MDYAGACAQEVWLSLLLQGQLRKPHRRYPKEVKVLDEEFIPLFLALLWFCRNCSRCLSSGDLWETFLRLRV